MTNLIFLTAIILGFFSQIKAVDECYLTISELKYRDADSIEWQNIPLDSDSSLFIKKDKRLEFSVVFDYPESSNITIIWSANGVRYYGSTLQLSFNRTIDLLMYAYVPREACNPPLKEALRKIPIVIDEIIIASPRFDPHLSSAFFIVSVILLFFFFIIFLSLITLLSSRFCPCLRKILSATPGSSLSAIELA